MHNDNNSLKTAAFRTKNLQSVMFDIDDNKKCHMSAAKVTSSKNQQWQRTCVLYIDDTMMMPWPVSEHV